ncbi:MAG: adenosylmethionine--8-amino-7-oxononanoate transaminase [Planctomycetota bacterium]|jgi:adenosylmethionine-8-amino-7-oxononanoate aminotransferase
MDNAEIARLKEEDKKYVWHPFTQMEDWIHSDPLIIAKGRGITLIDIEGKRYLDGVSSLWTNVHGHGVPALDRALQDQAEKLAHSTLLGLGSVPSIELARELVRKSPEGLDKVFYSDSGSTAVEVALKMAFQYWQQQGTAKGKKTRFACLSDAYHGDTIGSVSVGGIGLFHAIYKPLLFKTIQLPSPYCYRCPLGLERPGCDLACADEAEKTIRTQRDDLAAVVVEPLVQGAAGMIVHPEGFLKRIARACSENNVFLIVDEVATGFGRTGKLFACEHEAVSPDFLALAKGLSGGYLPLAATLASNRIFEGFLGTFESKRTFFHGHTYTGNALACSVALANLVLFDTEGVLDHARKLAEELTGRLETMAGLPHVGDIRQRGLMAGIELVKDRETRDPFDMGLRVGHRVILEARKRGAIFRPLGDVLVVMPPLATSSEELEAMIGILRESLQAVMEEL